MTKLSIRPAWTPLNIALMVLGFILFWPLGLAMLVWIIWGERIRDWYYETRIRVEQKSRGRATGNDAFDAYRRRELDRLEAERRRLDSEVEEFETFLADLKRARDRDEFDRFMSERGDRARHGEATGGSAQPA